MKKHPRTTHSDLAELLELFAKKLKDIPAGYCVSDANSLRLLTDAANALRKQDARVDELTIALRELGPAARKHLR